MIAGSDSPATTQTNLNCLKKIPSRLVGWFRGKFTTIATKIKYFFLGEGSTRGASKSGRTRLVDRKVTSDFQEQDYSSVVMTSGSHVSKSARPVINGAVLRHTCVEVLRPVTKKITELMEDLKSKARLVIRTCDKQADSIDQLRLDFDINISELLAKRIDVNESFVNERNDYFKLLKDNLSKQRNEFVNLLQRIESFYSELIEKVAEICDFGESLTSKYINHSSELASEEEVRWLQREVLQLNLMLADFNKGKIGHQIAFDAQLQTKLSDIQKVLENIMQTLKKNPRGTV